MDAEEFRACLERARINQARLARILDAHGGGERSYSSVNRWANGHKRPLPVAAALVRLLAARPELVDELESLAPGDIS